MLYPRRSPTPDLEAEGVIRALVADGESPSRERVRSLLEQRPNVEVVAECETGLEAVRAIEAESPDLLFLDVVLPELNGLAVLEAIGPERAPQVVFVTASDDYLQHAFDLHALDYLRKPFTEERFHRALRHACERVKERLGYEEALMLLAESRYRSEQADDCLAVEDKEHGVYRVVRAQEIDCIEADAGGILVHVGKDAYSSRHTLSAVQERLDPVVFLRVHRHYLVNRARISTVKPMWKGEYVLTLLSGRSLSTGRTYHAAVEALLN